MSIADREPETPSMGEVEGLPDVALLTRLANEMFKAMPEGVRDAAVDAVRGVVPAAPVIHQGLAAPGLPTSPGVVQAPADFPTGAAVPSGSLPDGLLPAPLPRPEALPSLEVSPWLPPNRAGLATPPVAGAPSFYFLELVDRVATASEQASASPAQPTEAKAPPSNDAFAFAPSLGPAIETPGAIFDPASLRRDFPILNERVHGKRLIWLDNAATTQKPESVIQRLEHFYQHENSNIHRAAHTLAARATDAYEGARETVRRFLNASSASEVVFARGATEAINLVAQTYGERNVQPGDEVVLTWLEHHSNIVPWQLLCARKGARLRVVPVDDRGQVLLDQYERLLGPRTRIVAITHVSNALGTVVPVQQMTEMAHRHGARVLVDGAQAVSHMPVDVQVIDCDWYAFSGHKVFGPTGIGALYGKREVLESMPPWQGGGNMIADVTFEKTVYESAPARFEAGTGNIADAVGLGAALDYVMGVGLANVARHEHRLLEYATRKLEEIPGLRIIGTAAEKAGVISFVLPGRTTDEVGKALNLDRIAVRTGHHCAQPALRRFGLESTVRPSFALYNTCEDIDALVAAVARLQQSS